MEPKRDKNLDLVIRNNVFYGNNLLYFIYKKCIKISKAVYLVTDIIKDVEPMKWALRKVASSLAVIKDSEDVRKIGQAVAVKVSNIKTLILIANFSKNVSDMNTAVLVKECDELHLLIDELDSFSKQHLSLDKDFFGVLNTESPSPFLSTLLSEKSHLAPHDFKGHLKDRDDRMSFKSSLPRDTKSILERSLNVKDNIKQSRSEQIIEIIKNKGEVTIKDISSLIKDCSEKTIQRVLIDLLSQGTIKRTGDRRWSRYSLK